MLGSIKRFLRRDWRRAVATYKRRWAQTRRSLQLGRTCPKCGCKVGSPQGQCCPECGLLQSPEWTTRWPGSRTVWRQGVLVLPTFAACLGLMYALQAAWRTVILIEGMNSRVHSTNAIVSIVFAIGAMTLLASSSAALYLYITKKELWLMNGPATDACRTAAIGIIQIAIAWMTWAVISGL